MWTCRVISDAVLARADYLKLEKDIQAFQRIKHSWKLSDMPEDEKLRLDAQLSALETQFESRKKDLNTLTRRLIDSDFWPAFPKSAAVVVRETVEDLQAKVQDIYGTIQKMEALRLPSNTVAASAPKEESPIVETDRPAKRRRMESEEAKTDAQSNEKARGFALSRDLDSLRDQVLVLEGEISVMQNDLVQFDNNLLDQLNDEMERKFELYGLHGPAEGSKPSTHTSVPHSVPPIPPEKVGVLESGLQKAGEDITEIAQEVGTLITRSNTRDSDMVLLHQENEQLKLQVNAVSPHGIMEIQIAKFCASQLQQLQLQNMQTLETQKAEIDALKAAVTIFVSQAKPDPPPMPSIDEIVASCRPQLVYAMRQEIQPLLEDMKGAVETMLQAQSTELCNTVLSKLSATLQKVQGIADWAERLKQNGHPLINGVNGTVPQNKSPAG